MLAIPCQNFTYIGRLMNQKMQFYKNCAN